MTTPTTLEERLLKKLSDRFVQESHEGKNVTTGEYRYAQTFLKEVVFPEILLDRATRDRELREKIAKAYRLEPGKDDYEHEYLLGWNKALQTAEALLAESSK